MQEPFRLSRLAVPRSTPAASLLLVVVFTLFGLCTDAFSSAAPWAELANLDIRLLALRHWLMGL